MTRAYVSIGSNLKNSTEEVLHAISALARLPKTHLTQQSRFFRSKPIGVIHQPDFINAVVELETSLEAPVLLQHLQDIENSRGRSRTLRWGPRVLDLDILLYGCHEVHTDHLTLPHPEMIRRAFVLKPLLELNPDCTLPSGERVKHFLPLCAHQSLTPIEVI